MGFLFLPTRRLVRSTAPLLIEAQALVPWSFAPWSDHVNEVDALPGREAARGAQCQHEAVEAGMQLG